MGKQLILGLMIAVLVSGCQYREETAAAAFTDCMEAGGIEVFDVHFEFDENGRMVESEWSSQAWTPQLGTRANACMEMVEERFARRPRLSPQP